MNLWVHVGDRTVQVELSESDGHPVVVVDGREMAVEIEEEAPGLYTLLLNGHPCDLVAAERPGGYSFALCGVPLDLQVEDERQRRLSSRSVQKMVAEGKISIRAPMPGLVTRVDVQPADEVTKGQRLLVLEAMKMENDLSTPRPARIEKVLVVQGQTVEQGQILVTLE